MLASLLIALLTQSKISLAYDLTDDWLSLAPLDNYTILFIGESFNIS